MSCVPAPQQETCNGTADSACCSNATKPQLNCNSKKASAQQSAVYDSVSSASFLKRLVLRRLNRIKSGSLVVQDGGQTWRFGGSDETEPALIVVQRSDFYSRLIASGSLGAAESYIQGDWDTPDLAHLLQVLARNADAMNAVDGKVAKLTRPLRVAVNWLKRNTKAGSRRNISAHYDLSNEFFALMLDKSMTYSSAVFHQPDMTLGDAQFEKYDRICRKLELKPEDHLLEIGTGWGGFAMHAVKNYGCRVTTTTISEEQHSLAQSRFREAGLEDYITLLQQDYRDLRGEYDKLVSIEMIEAVGEKYLPSFFEQCSRLLKPSGAMAIQAITIPDHRYDAYRNSVDFIQRYIFPGGFLPSIRAIGQCLASHTDLRFLHCEDFGPHYGKTLQMWRQNFCNSIDHVRKLNFDDRFIRTWEYYLCYCQAGFEERLIGVSQFVFTKPLARMEPIL